MKALRLKGVSQRSACKLVAISERAMQYVTRRAADDTKLIDRMKAIARERLRWGWRRLLIMIRREGFVIGERAFRRIYKSLSLHLTRTRKRHVRYVRGNVVEPAQAPNARWSMDFMHDRLDHGRPFRLLNIVDDFSAECLAIEGAFSFGSADVGIAASGNVTATPRAVAGTRKSSATPQKRTTAKRPVRRTAAAHKIA